MADGDMIGVEHNFGHPSYINKRKVVGEGVEKAIICNSEFSHCSCHTGIHLKHIICFDTYTGDVMQGPYCTELPTSMHAENKLQYNCPNSARLHVLPHMVTMQEAGRERTPGYKEGLAKEAGCCNRRFGEPSVSGGDIALWHLK